MPYHNKYKATDNFWEINTYFNIHVDITYAAVMESHFHVPDIWVIALLWKREGEKYFVYLY